MNKRGLSRRALFCAVIVCLCATQVRCSLVQDELYWYPEEDFGAPFWVHNSYNWPAWYSYPLPWHAVL